MMYLSHAIVILVHGIELETSVQRCSTNHISTTAVDSLFRLITYSKMIMACDKCTRPYVLEKPLHASLWITPDDCFVQQGSQLAWGNSGKTAPCCSDVFTWIDILYLFIECLEFLDICKKPKRVLGDHLKIIRCIFFHTYFHTWKQVLLTLMTVEFYGIFSPLFDFTIFQLFIQLLGFGRTHTHTGPNSKYQERAKIFINWTSSFLNCLNDIFLL